MTTVKRSAEPADALRAKRESALRRLREGGRSLIVALSGGVDSALLLALAMEALGRERVLAVTGRSPSLPIVDLEDARRVARALGARHEIVATEELNRPEYRANTGDRWFHCRTELFEILGKLARDRGFECIAYGAITDDQRDDRPGMRAAEQHRIRAPLLEAGLAKSEVRLLATELGLAVRDKPAGACLASRIPVGDEVTPGRLAQVGQAEQALRELGFVQFRVRHHGRVARLELDADGERRIGESGLRARVLRAVREAGFRHVALDLEGYRSGSLNPDPVLYRIGPTRDGGQ